MLDIKYIVENEQKVRQNIIDRNMECDIDRLLTVYRTLKDVRAKVEGTRTEINQNQKKIKSAASDAERQEIVANGKQLKETLAAAQQELTDLEAEYQALMYTVPNMMADDTPIGKNEDLNVEVDRFMEPTKFDFQPKNHVELGKALDLRL